MSQITRRELAAIIDHTILKPTTTAEDIARVCREAKEYGFFAVCVNSFYVPLACQMLAGSNVKLCSAGADRLGTSSGVDILLDNPA